MIDFQDNAFDKGKQERVESSLFSTCLHHDKDIKNSWVPEGGFQPPDLSIKIRLALKVKDTRCSDTNWADRSPHTCAYQAELKFSHCLAEPTFVVLFEIYLILLTVFVCITAIDFCPDLALAQCGMATCSCSETRLLYPSPRSGVVVC